MMRLEDKETTFATLSDTVGLDIRLRKAISRLGFVRPTLVQSKCLPLAISSGKDLFVRARTGSGKTLAYLLPILQKLLTTTKMKQQEKTKGFVRAIILVPTRELTAQVSKVLQSLMYYCNEEISIAELISSVSATSRHKNEATIAKQEAMLRDRPAIIVTTPASLLPHIREGGVLHDTLRYSVECLVIDEADLILSFGYSHDIEEIIQALPNIFQGFLMSATLSPEIASLKKLILHSPVILKLEEDDETNFGSSVNKKEGLLTQFYLPVPKKDKNLVIYVFLKLGLLKGKGLFFVNTTDAGYRLKLFLEQFHIRSSVLNGELPLNSRLNIIEQFNVGNFDYLIATDESTDAHTVGKKHIHAMDDNERESQDQEQQEDPDNEEVEEKTKVRNRRSKKSDLEYGVSRGLDFRGVSFVLNVDFPLSSSSYTHRIGRTARGGAKGVALSLIDSDSLDQMEMLAEVQSKQPPLYAMPMQGFSETLQPAPVADSIESNDSAPTSITQPQPTLLQFDLSEIEGFRYRVEDVGRAVTKVAVKETRAAEIRAEIINSQRLQSHFEENKADLQLLRHDRVATHISKVQDHLKHVPTYLLPRGMQVADVKRKRKKRHTQRNRNDGANQYGRRKDNDPLQSFDTEGMDLDDTAEDIAGDETVFEDPLHDENDEPDSSPIALGKKARTDEHKVVLSTRDRTGRSTSGRNAWKEKRGKGRFSRKAKK